MDLVLITGETELKFDQISPESSRSNNICWIWIHDRHAWSNFVLWSFSQDNFKNIPSCLQNSKQILYQKRPF